MNTNKISVTPIKCTRCALFTALIIVGAYIKIPLPPVPFTLQTFFVILSGLVLGAGYGAASVALYMFMGLIGLPVFAGGASGPASVLMPTFGYIIGFLIAAFAGGRLSVKPGFKNLLAASFASMLIIYICGMGYYYIIQTLYLHNDVNIKEFLITFGAMTAPKDIILCPIIAAAAMRLRRIIKNGSR